MRRVPATRAQHNSAPVIGTPAIAHQAAASTTGAIPPVAPAPEAARPPTRAVGQQVQGQGSTLSILWKRLSTPQAQLRLAWGLTIVCIILYMALISLWSLFRYWTFHATAYDLGNMDQVFWNTLHGRFFEFTNRGWDYYGPPTRLAIHVEPIILPLSLLYLIHSGPETLLVFQSVALGLGAIPVFLLTRHWMPRWPLMCLPLVATYLLAPGLIGENVFDFHPVALATPLLIAAVLAMEKQHYGWFLLAGGLAAMTKEDVGFTVAMLGIYIAFWHHRRWFGLLVAAFFAGWSIFCFLVIIPHFLDSPQVGNNYWERYAGLGNTPGEAIIHLLTQPWLVAVVILNADKVRYIWHLALTGGMIGLVFAPLAIFPALPELSINILSDQAAQYSGVYQYNSILVAFLTIAVIKGTAIIARHLERDREGWAALNHFGRIRLMLRKHFLWRWMPLWFWWIALKIGSGWAWLVQRIAPRVAMAIVALILLAAAGYNLLAAKDALGSFVPPFSIGTREERINRLLEMIPPDASVSASDTLNPHLSERQDLFLFPDYARGDDIAQYIVIDVNYLPPEVRATAIATFDFLTQHGVYRIIARADSVYLAKLQVPESG